MGSSKKHKEKDHKRKRKHRSRSKERSRSQEKEGKRRYRERDDEKYNEQFLSRDLSADREEGEIEDLYGNTALKPEPAGKLLFSSSDSGQSAYN